MGKVLTFKGGVDVPGNKEMTEGKSIEVAKTPERVYIPLQQHIGAPCEVNVEVGDKVKIGQVVGKAGGFVSSNIHSSISGEVVEVTNMDTPTGLGVKTVVIESDGKEEWIEGRKKYDSLEDLTKEEILEIIKEAGITGLGGASFPTHIKLSPPEDKKIDKVIINGAECEPYLTADHRLMLEHPEEIIFGLKAILKVLGVEEGIIAIEDNKMDAVEVMRKTIGNDKSIKVEVLKTKYPQGDEKRIISAVTGREVPSGGLPMEVGCVVSNVGTVRAISEAIQKGKPVIERVVTVTGKCVKEPKNLLAKIGTPFKDLIEQAGGFKEEPGKVIQGGAMMGIAQYSLDVPVIKGTSGILTLTKEEAEIEAMSYCIKCGRCLEVCPVNLQPLYISAYMLKENLEKAEEYSAADCVECGACSYICPARRPLTESIRLAKREILAARKK